MPLPYVERWFEGPERVHLQCFLMVRGDKTMNDDGDGCTVATYQCCRGLSGYEQQRMVGGCGRDVTRSCGNRRSQLMRYLGEGGDPHMSSIANREGSGGSGQYFHATTGRGTQTTNVISHSGPISCDGHWRGRTLNVPEPIRELGIPILIYSVFFAPCYAGQPV